jgi:LacI family transcriptional regulator
VAGNVTLGDVARAAGVSLATASRALDPGSGRRVRPDLKARVLDAAARLDYSPNTQAQAMARGTTSVVGLVVHDIADPYFSSIAAGVTRVAAQHGLIVSLATTLRDPQREVDYVRMLRGQRARVLIVAGSRVVDRTRQDQLEHELGLYARAGGRVAFVSQPKLPYDTVQVQNRAGARDLAHRLHELGHRRFAILAAPSKLLTSTERVDGFRDALRRLGCPVARDHVVRAAFTRDGGYDAMSRLLASGADVTCTFATNDVMAVGAMAALRDHGVPLPEGMAVAGFDDIATLRDITPGLTTISLPMEAMGERALTMALEDSDGQPRVHPIVGDVIVRESTPPASQMVRRGRLRAVR